MTQHLYGVDFGTNDALAVHDNDGPVDLRDVIERVTGKRTLPRVTGGASTSDKFIRVLPILLATGNVVVESATVGASGVEPDEVAKVVENAQHTLYTLSNRATKNYKKDQGMVWDKGARYSRDGDPVPIDLHEQPNVHATDAEIIYTIASETPARLRVWGLPTDRLTRQHTSVRPYDKRNYRGIVPDMFMSRFPDYRLLPAHLQQFLGNGYGTDAADYSRARAMPLAMAMDEPGSDTRDGYEKVLGLYDHGYPSFYRRLTVALMQSEGKRLADVTRMGEVPQRIRKEAWKATRRNIRQIWHLF